MFSFSLADAYRQQSASIFSPLCHELYQRKLRDEHSSVFVNSFPLINAIPTFATTLCRLKVYANIDLSYLCFHISSSHREHLVISISIISKSRIRRAKIKKKWADWIKWKKKFNSICISCFENDTIEFQLGLFPPFFLLPLLSRNNCSKASFVICCLDAYVWIRRACWSDLRRFLFAF